MISAKRFGIGAMLAMTPVFVGECIAGTLSVSFDGVNPVHSLSLSHTGTTAEPASSQAGVFNWTQVSFTDPPLQWTTTAGTQIDSFCIELTQNVGSVYTTTTNIALAPSPGSPDGPMGTTGAFYLKKLWNNVMTTNDLDVSTGLFKFNNGGAETASVAAVRAAAFQLAVWELMNDSDLSLTSGAFTGGSNNLTVRNQAQAYLDALDGSGFTTPWVLVAMMSSTRQDQITAVRSVSTTTVPDLPTPAAAGLGMLGLAVVVLRRYRATAGFDVR